MWKIQQNTYCIKKAHTNCSFWNYVNGLPLALSLSLTDLPLVHIGECVFSTLIWGLRIREKEQQQKKYPSLDLAVILEIMNCQDEPNEFIFYTRLCAFFSFFCLISFYFASFCFSSSSSPISSFSFSMWVRWCCCLCYCWCCQLACWW